MSRETSELSAIEDIYEALKEKFYPGVMLDDDGVVEDFLWGLAEEEFGERGGYE